MFDFRACPSGWAPGSPIRFHQVFECSHIGSQLRFIEAGHKVKFTVRFRGREITHPEKAQEQLTWVIQQTEDIANVETRAMMEGRTMTVMVAPKPAIMQKVAQAKIAAEKARQQAEKEGRTLPEEPSLPSMTDVNAGHEDDDDDEDEAN